MAISTEISLTLLFAAPVSFAGFFPAVFPFAVFFFAAVVFLFLPEDGFLFVDEFLFLPDDGISIPPLLSHVLTGTAFLQTPCGHDAV